MRTFLIPMQAPVNGTGKGTREDPWRPKYLKELGLGLNNASAVRGQEGFYLGEVGGPEKAIEQLAAQPDVVELTESDDPLPAAKIAKVEGVSRNLALARKGTGREVVASLRQAMQDKQIATRQQSVGDAVKGALRAGD